MGNLTLGHFLEAEGFGKLEVPNNNYHKLVFWPSWFKDEKTAFYQQIIDMSSPKKSFKVTDTFKMQAGYPHEVEKSHQEILVDKGVKRDKFSNDKKVNIPKLNRNDFSRLWDEKNIFAFTTPTNSKYVRDVGLMDTDTHEKLVFFYIINRKAQIITAWSELKIKGKHKLKLSKNIFKNSMYVKE